jgi:hypothetical protein
MIAVSKSAMMNNTILEATLLCYCSRWIGDRVDNEREKFVQLAVSKL